MSGPADGSRLGHEQRVLLLALLAGAPGVLVSAAVLLTGDFAPWLRWGLIGLVVAVWFGAASAVRSSVVRPLQTLANLFAAMREEDFSFRARVSSREDALGGAMAEVNALAATLRAQRLGALESTALLRKVMEEIDVAVFAFDGEDRLRLANRFGERLLGRPVEQLLGRRAEELGLAEGLRQEAPAVLEAAFPGGSGRWEARRGTFRQGGLVHRLLVLADVSRLAAEVAQRERDRRELEIAREVQERLFPQALPPLPDLDYIGGCRTARQVGGDYYDFLPLPHGRLGFAIGDISGKGVPAALLMAGLQASLRMRTLRAGDDLAGLMRDINRLIHEVSPPNRYATFFYGQLDPATRALVYVNAGHNAPMIFRGEEILRLTAGGPVVGLLPAVSYEQATISLAPGDVLVAFTDGVSEAMNANDDEWGEAHLIETVRAARDLPARELSARIMAAADAFVAGAPQHDDMTVVVLRLTSRGEASGRVRAPASGAQ